MLAMTITLSFFTQTDLIFVERSHEGWEDVWEIRNEGGASLFLNGRKRTARCFLHPLVRVQNPLQQLQGTR